MPDTVHLRIQNPYQEPVDMGAISEALTIRELKETLQREYPGRPPVSAQRLILSGKLLSDSESLGGLVADSDGVAEKSLVLHLVVKDSPVVEIPAKASPKVAKPAQEPLAPPAIIPQQQQQQHTQIVMIAGIPYAVDLPILLGAQSLSLRANNNPQVMPPPQVPVAPQQPQDPADEFEPEGNSPFFVLFRLAFLFMILAQTGSTLRVVSLGLACLVLGLFQLGYLDWVGRIAQRWRPVAPQPPLLVAQPEQGNNEDAAGQPAPAIPQVDSAWKSLAITLLSFVTSIFPLGDVPA